MIKKIIKKALQICMAFAVMLAPVLAVGNNNAKVYAVYNGTALTPIQLTVGNSTTIESTGVEALKTALSISDYSDLSSVTTSGQSVASSNIYIEFGGITWLATYLSKSSAGDNDVILTLWMAKYGTTPISSSWNDYGDGETSDTYPSNMYGTSKIRAVLTGADYATSKNAASLTPGTSLQNSAFTVFTGSGALSSYIVSPQYVSWQEDGQHLISGGKDFPNENWGNVTNGNFNSGYNYYGKTGNDAWKIDNLWLPSLYEVGYESPYIGLWNTTETQKQYGTNGSDDNGYSWLRSGRFSGAERAIALSPSGGIIGLVGGNGGGVTAPAAVRPALHLNLKEILPQEAADTGVFVDIVLPVVFVAVVGTLAVLYISQGKKKKRLI